jgi:hypothetical protein
MIYVFCWARQPNNAGNQLFVEKKRQFGYKVFASVKTQTFSAPLFLRTFAQLETVAPEVKTSSTNKILAPSINFGRFTSNATSTLAARALPSIPTRCIGVWIWRTRLSSSSLMPDCLTRIFDKTAAWLNPRSRKLFLKAECEQSARHLESRSFENEKGNVFVSFERRTARV